MKKIYIVVALITMLGIGCSEVPVVLPEKVIPQNGKTVLVEDITGVRCANCPRAAAKLKEIAEQFPDNVIIVAVHGGAPGDDLNKPYPESKFDFRHEEAQALEDYLKPFAGKPAAAFSRRQFENPQIFSLSNITVYQSKVEEIIQEDAPMNIELDYIYDEDTRELSINAGIIPTDDLEGDFHVTVMVTESELVDYQLDATIGDLNTAYLHEHVLRDIITNVQGDQFAASITKSELIPLSWNYTVPESTDGWWIAENLEIVIAISDHSGGGKEVLQAAKFKLK